jgi:ribosomal protein S18 acetylase RimI-like enzyme
MAEIIKATENHFKELTDIWVRFMAVHSHYDAYFQLRAEAAEKYQWFLKRMIESDDSVILIIIDGNKIAGRVFCQISDHPPIYKYDQYGWIIEIEVLDEYRGRGWGKLLMAKAHEWFKAKGIHRIELEVAHKNSGAIAFWQKLGFIDVYHKLYYDI